MKATPQKLGKQLEEAFGGPLTAKQLWAITVFAKHVRLRARNNSAFNNLCNSAFPYAGFRQVTKHHKDGTPYPGLEITVKEETISEDEDSQ